MGRKTSKGWEREEVPKKHGKQNHARRVLVKKTRTSKGEEGNRAGKQKTIETGKH